MTHAELDRELRLLAGGVQWPPAPDVAGRLGAALSGVLGRPLPPRARAPRLRIALAVLLALLIAAAAVPPVRAAVGRLLGIAGGERIERVQRVPAAARLDLGRPVTLAEAQRVAGFRVAVPRALGAPDGVRVGGDLGDGTVSVLYGTDTVLSQRRGSTLIAMKSVGPGVRVTPVRVGSASAFWITRGPRVVILLGRSGNPERVRAALRGAGVLLWDHRGLALRLETRRPLHAALEIADSVP